MNSYEFSTNYDYEKTLGNLRLVTPDNRGRYDKAYDPKIQPDHLTIPAGLDLGHPSPQSKLPQHWSRYVHPEGQPYFLRSGDGSPLHVVTESWVEDPEILARLVPYIDEIERLLVETATQMSESSKVELYVRLEDPDEGCGYYLIEHTVRTIFWVHEMGTEEMGLAPAVSPTHLHTELQGLYWEHVEHFPMHFGADGLGREWIEDLVCVVAHGRLDQLTSRDSTFAYSAEECAHILDVLRDSKDRPASGHVICLAARVWSMICDTQRYHLHGEQHPRLSRTQAVLHDPATKYGRISVLTYCLSFNLSTMYLVKLNDVFGDGTVYKLYWKSMIVDCVRDWTEARQAASSALLFHFFLFFVDSDIRVATASAVLLVSSFIAAKILIHFYHPLQNMTSGEARSYLLAIRSSTFNFQFVALVFSLPGALGLWGLLILLANCGMIFARHFGAVPTTAVSAACGFGMLVFLWTTSAEVRSCFAWPGFSRYFARVRPALNLDDEV